MTDTTIELRICSRGCKIRHYENCPDCFGFGLWTHSGGIISADEAHNQVITLPTKICPTCKSGINGIPDD